MPDDKTEGGARDLRSDIALMQTVYGVFMTLAFRHLAESFYSFVAEEAGRDIGFVTLTAPGTALVLLGLRFFWAVGNIRRFIIRRSPQLGDRLPRYVTTLFFPTLIFHAFLYYYLSKLHKDMLQAELFEARAIAFVVVYVGFLILNVAWLWALTYGIPKPEPEGLWIRNNAITAFIAAIGFAALRYFSFDLRASIVLVSCVFLANSVIDLWRTAGEYILGYTRQQS